MAGVDRRTGKPIGRQEHIAQSIDALLHTAQGTRVLRRHLGVDFLDEEGRPLLGLGPATVEAKAHDALTEYEPRVDLDAVTAHFDGEVLTSIRVAYRDKEDASQHEVTVLYETT